MKKMCFCLTILSLSFLILISYGTTVDANANLNLKNGDAFSGKNNYYQNAKYDIVTSYTHHGEAWENAVNKMNAISNTSINLISQNGIHIKMRSVNTSNYTWYGHANWNKESATLKLNEYTTSKKNFTTGNYNKTALHELGHAFYMKHQPDSVVSVMKSGQYSYNDYSSLDKGNLRFKY